MIYITTINCWFMNIVKKYFFLKAVLIIGDPDDWTSDSVSFTVRSMNCKETQPYIFNIHFGNLRVVGS